MEYFWMFVAHVSVEMIRADDFVGAVLALEALVAQVEHVVAFDFFFAAKGTHFDVAIGVVVEVDAEFALVL